MISVIEVRCEERFTGQVRLDAAYEKLTEGVLLLCEPVELSKDVE